MCLRWEVAGGPPIRIRRRLDGRFGGCVVMIVPPFLGVMAMSSDFHDA